MIRIEINRNKEGFVKKFTVRGHSGYARQGKDIICSAISAIAYTCIGSLEELAGIHDTYKIKDGFMTCFIPEDLDETKLQVSKIVLDTCIIGFKQIELSYEKYVKVVDEEV